MKKEDGPYLHHIRESIKNLKIATKDLSEDKFVGNELVREYAVRKLEIMGEAVKNSLEHNQKRYSKA